MLRCWADKYCKQVGQPGCNNFCAGYVILEILYKQSDIPKRYQYPQILRPDEIDEDVYNYIYKIITGDVVEWVKDGNNLLLWGENRGNGKTSLACGVANKYIREMVHISNFEPVVYFIKTAKFLEDLRHQYSNPTLDFPNRLKIIENVPLLIIDDIGAERPNDWVRERLLTIIDERYSNNRSIIYTSNCSLAELHESLKGRISDRINDAKSLHFRGTSKRGINR